MRPSSVTVHFSSMQVYLPCSEPAPRRLSLSSPSRNLWRSLSRSLWRSLSLSRSLSRSLSLSRTYRETGAHRAYREAFEPDETPIEKHIEPIEKTIEKPIETPIEMPEPIEKPVEQPEPIEKPIEKPIEPIENLLSLSRNLSRNRSSLSRSLAYRETCRAYRATYRAYRETYRQACREATAASTCRVDASILGLRAERGRRAPGSNRVERWSTHRGQILLPIRSSAPARPGVEQSRTFEHSSGRSFGLWRRRAPGSNRVERGERSSGALLNPAPCTLNSPGFGAGAPGLLNMAPASVTVSSMMICIVSPVLARERAAPVQIPRRFRARTGSEPAPVQSPRRFRASAGSEPAPVHVQRRFRSSAGSEPAPVQIQ